MPLVQKYLSWAFGLGAAFLVLTHPEGAYKAAQGVRSVVGGTIVDITTGKSKA